MSSTGEKKKKKTVKRMEDAAPADKKVLSDLFNALRNKNLFDLHKWMNDQNSWSDVHSILKHMSETGFIIVGKISFDVRPRTSWLKDDKHIAHQPCSVELLKDGVVSLTGYYPCYTEGCGGFNSQTGEVGTNYLSMYVVTWDFSVHD